MFDVQTSEFIAIDLETTGLDSVLDRIVEVGAIRFDRRGEELATFQSLVNPGRPCDPRAAAVHGISDGELALAPPARPVLERFLEFLAESPNAVLLAHNASFDAAFLGSEFARSQLVPPSSPIVDTLAIARRAFPEFRTHRLDSVSRLLGFDRSDAHRAIGDCRRVKLLMLAALERIELDSERPHAFSMRENSAASAAPQGWEELVRAAKAGIRVRIVYEGGSKGTAPREITPRRFLNRAGTTYLVSFCHLSGIEKEFRLDRVRRFELLEASPLR